MKLSIFIPVFNEEKTIQTVIDAIFNLELPWKKEIIVVNDGSTDSTKNILSLLQNKYPEIIIINLKKNSGKGHALKQAVKIASGDFLIIQDADLEYNPKDIQKMIKNIQNGEKLAIYGSRFLNKERHISFIYYFGNVFLTYITNVLLKTRLTDMETGYKLLPLRFLRETRLTSNRFEIEPEITIKLIKKGYIIKEVPISYHGRNKILGKKITPKDGFYAVFTILKLCLQKG